MLVYQRVLGYWWENLLMKPLHLLEGKLRENPWVSCRFSPTRVRSHRLATPGWTGSLERLHHHGHWESQEFRGGDGLARQEVDILRHALHSMVAGKSPSNGGFNDFYGQTKTGFAHFLRNLEFTLNWQIDPENNQLWLKTNLQTPNSWHGLCWFTEW